MTFRSVLVALALGLALASQLPAAASTARRSWDSCTSGPGDLRFRAADGTRLVGHRFGSGRTAVVLVHQSDGNLCQWVPYARRLAGLGYLAFVFDLRNVGDSQTRGPLASSRWGGDVAAAAKFVRSLGAMHVFLLGASLGGSAAVDAAANVQPKVAGVVSVSGAADLANALVAARLLRVPVLYLAGKYDLVFANDAKRLYAATQETAKAIAVLPNGEHGVNLVATSAKARHLIEQFLRRSG